MPYPTQHENFYKNQVIQLQQELEQLTETYNYRLISEAGGVGWFEKWVAAGSDKSTIHAAQRAASEASSAAGRAFATTPEFLAQSAIRRAASEAREAAERILMARFEAFSRMTNDEIIAAINAAINSGDTAFHRYVLDHYGQIVRVGSSYQRLLPDGTVLHLNSNGNWVPINKPGFMSAFGFISANGRAHDPATLWQLAGSGASPGSYTLGSRSVPVGQTGLSQTAVSPTGPGY